MKKLLPIVLLAGLTTIGTSCQKDAPAKPEALLTVSGELKGANIAPDPVTTTAGTGNVVGSFNKNTNELTYTFTFSGLSGPITLAHLHLGAPGVKGPHFYTAPTTTSPILGKATLTAAQRDALLTNNMYVNLHTNKHQVFGEIRANLVVK